LYVLKLEGTKYYIGVTSKTPEERYLEHRNGFYGAEWTKIHKPIEIEQSKDLGFTTYEKAGVYENKVTRQYVKKYGIDNVRGG
jgi:predicted GIY-YIG superfamily endonuclease